MHELSIALSIVEGAEEEVETHGGGRIATVYLKLGKLSGVVKEALQFSYLLACEGTILEGSALIIEEVPVTIFCAKCNDERELPSLELFCCPTCQTPSGQVVHGREIQLTALEMQA